MQSRSDAIKLLREKQFDLAVIGGGIAGAGIAQNAAARGLSVLLLDRGDFAAGASSKTSKCLQDGLHADPFKFQVTSELSHECVLLERLAPHLIKEFSFILPIAADQRFEGMKKEMGLKLAELFSSDKNRQSAKKSAYRHRLTQKDLLAAAPALAAEKVTGGLRIKQLLTDDCRLVIELIKSASAMGAVCVNYVSAQGFELEDGRVNRVLCRDRYSGQDLAISCKSCIVAAGAWTDRLMEKLDQSWQKRSSLTKTAHIIIPNSAFETSYGLLLPSSEEDHIFVVPWQKALIVGCSEIECQESNDQALADENQIQYLLEAINRFVRQDRPVARSDVIAAWAGINARVKDGVKSGKSACDIFEGPSGIVGLTGVKLGDYRIISERVVETIVAALPETVRAALKPAATYDIMLGGWSSKEDYLTCTAEISARARRLAIDPAGIDHLCMSYGKDALKVLDIAESDQYLNKRICPDFPPIQAEVVYAIKNEMAVCLEDIMFRRIGLALVNQVQALQATAKIARLVQGVLGWDDARTEAEVNVLTKTLEEHLSLKAETGNESLSEVGSGL